MKQNTLKFLVASTLFTTACAPTASEKPHNYSELTVFTPPTYVCYKAPAPITIDGKMDAAEWDAIPWSSEFVDIEGDKQPKPTLQTRTKMTYTNEGMYFACLMEEPHVWGNITEHDAVIYHDNDFEIFLNPSNDTHNYLEYEINALGTDWDLYLSKPYRDAGHAILNNWEFAGMQKAVHIDGTLNNPSDTDKSWSVEVFIPWKSIYQVMRGKETPVNGEQLRVNFSRVQWATEVKDGKYVKIPKPGKDKIAEYNWVWSPSGVINIHLPESWGFVQISDKVAGKATDTFVTNPDEAIKWLLRNLYYRQNQYRGANKAYATQLATLQPETLGEDAAIIETLQLHTTPSMYEISVVSPHTGKTWSIRQDGFVW